MPSIAIESTTEAERSGLEQAIAFFTQMRRVAAAAPDGTVLAACEQVALSDGRRLVRDTLAAAVRGRADRVDEKRARPAPARAGGPGRRRGGAAGGC
jgi:hypothetical protein